MFDNKIFEKVSTWMYRNSRPLELAIWKYNFEGESSNEVIKALSSYENADGGFGHGLEADCLNPESSPMQTWAATDILFDLQDVSSECRIVSDILTYLENCPYFIENKWSGTIPSNDRFPHAGWWSYSEEMLKSWNWNPSAALAGFVLLYGNRESKVYKIAESVAVEAYNWFVSQEKMESMHETFCFMRLLEYCKRANLTTLFDLESFEVHLKKQISLLIEKNIDIWQSEYVCKPSFFITSKDSAMYEEKKKLLDAEIDFIVNTIGDDGVWEPSWKWESYPNEWVVSKVWWKANIAIKNVKFLKEMCIGRK